MVGLKQLLTSLLIFDNESDTTLITLHYTKTLLDFEQLAILTFTLAGSPVDDHCEHSESNEGKHGRSTRHIHQCMAIVARTTRTTDSTEEREREKEKEREREREIHNPTQGCLNR